MSKAGLCGMGACGSNDRTDGAYAFLLDYIGVAVIGIGEGGAQPLNSQAAVLLRGSHGLTAASDGLAAGLPEDTRAVRQAIAVVTGGSAVRPVALSIAGREEGSERLHLLVAPAPPASGLRAVVLAVDPATRPRPDAGLLRGWFGLSQREAELAVQLAMGDGLEDAARRLEIAVGTARTHLKRIFAKMGVSSQGQLVCLIRAHPILPDSTSCRSQQQKKS